MLCVWPLARWGPEKQNLSSDCPIFFYPFFFFFFLFGLRMKQALLCHPQKELQTRQATDKSIPSFSEGRNATVNNKNIPGIYGGLGPVSRFTAICLGDRAIQEVSRNHHPCLRNGETEAQRHSSWDRDELPAAGVGKISLLFTCVNWVNLFQFVKSVKIHGIFGDRVIGPFFVKYRRLQRVGVGEPLSMCGA